MDNKKDFGYAKQTTTAIWYEEPSQDNPYVASECRLHGYRHLDLCKNKNFAEVMLLLFTKELPTDQQSQLFEALMVAFINPGPRHPATRAAMIAGVSKTQTEHLLPIGLIVLGGEHHGSADVEQTMLFIKNNRHTAVADLVKKGYETQPPKDGQDWLPYPGIGSTYGSKDPVCDEFANYFAQFDAVDKSFTWLAQLIEEIDHPQVSWLSVGLFSALLLDLGIEPREGGVIFQLISAPGIAAHGLEQTHKPISSMPFLDDQHYELRNKNQHV